MNRSLALAALSVTVWPLCGAGGAEPLYTLKDIVTAACIPLETQRLKESGERDAEELAPLLCQTIAGICTKNAEEQGCEANLRNYDAELAKGGDSLLYEAAYLGDDAFVAAMIKYGATIDFRTQPPVTGPRTVGWTPLMIAAAEGHEPIVLRLITAGANVNVQNASGRTALMFAASYGFQSIAELLIENGANVNTVPNDDSGWPALIAAADAGHADMVELLLAHGADRTVRDKRGKTALMHAEEHKRRAVVRLLTAEP